jgi:hypothetical protein
MGVGLPGVFPRVISVRQRFPVTPALDIAAALDRTWRLPIPTGAQIALAVGSRGISRLQEVVKAVVARVRAAGAQPYIVPAMGSHGGATADGQATLLAEYGITEAALGVPVRAAMDVLTMATTDDGVPVHLAAEAARADGIIVIGRIKPHTKFRGPVESGLAKMIAVGLGKREGAAAFHIACDAFGFPRVVESMVRAKLAAARFLGGVALLENQHHALAELVVLPADEILRQEPALLAKAWAYMPRLPFADIDLLIVDAIGKNISGSGMDPNIIGRGHIESGETSPVPSQPVVSRLFVRELTPQTHGNAIGIGMADFTTTRLVQAIDREATYTNAITSLAFASPKIPIYFDSDREVLTRALATLPTRDPALVRLVRIRDTLSLDLLQASPACLQGLPPGTADALEASAPAQDLAFTAEGNLLAMPQT